MLTKSTINWVGECTYRLKQVWSNRKEQRKNNGRELTIQIIKIDGNRYEYTCNCNDPKNTEINGVVIKLSD